MIEGSPFCGQCRPRAEEFAASIRNEEQREMWRERIASQRRMMQSALISVQGTVASAANVAGGAGAMVVAGAAAALRGAYDGATSAAAASFESSRRLPPIVDGVLAPLPQSSDSATYEDACEGPPPIAATPPVTESVIPYQGDTSAAAVVPSLVVASPGASAPPVPSPPTAARPARRARLPGSYGSLTHAGFAAQGTCWTCLSDGRCHRAHTYTGDCKKAPGASSGASSSAAPGAAHTSVVSNSEQPPQSAPTYVPPEPEPDATGTDPHSMEDSSVRHMFAQLQTAVDAIQASVTHLTDRIAVIENSNVEVLERVSNMSDRLWDVELQVEANRVDIERLKNKQPGVDDATAEPDFQHFDMHSGTGTPRQQMDDEDEYERAFDMPPPRAPSNPFVTSPVVPAALGESSPGGCRATPSEVTFAPLGGGFPGGQGTVPLQLAEPQSAMELAVYHIPADMRADVGATPLPFPPPGLTAGPAVAIVERRQAGGGVWTARDESSVPQRAHLAALHGGASPRGAQAGQGRARSPLDDLQEPLTDHEVGLLVKLFASLGALPKLADIAVTHRSERLRAWKVALQMKLDGTRPVVQAWFHFIRGLLALAEGVTLRTFANSLRCDASPEVSVA